MLFRSKVVSIRFLIDCLIAFSFFTVEKSSVLGFASNETAKSLNPREKNFSDRNLYDGIDLFSRYQDYLDTQREGCILETPKMSFSSLFGSCRNV